MEDDRIITSMVKENSWLDQEHPPGDPMCVKVNKQEKVRVNEKGLSQDVNNWYASNTGRPCFEIVKIQF